MINTATLLNSKTNRIGKGRNVVKVGKGLVWRDGLDDNNWRIAEKGLVVWCTASSSLEPK